MSMNTQNIAQEHLPKEELFDKEYESFEELDTDKYQAVEKVKKQSS